MAFRRHQNQSSLINDLLAHVDDMNDVELVSKDGHVVGANKYVLGARSIVLRRALSQKTKLKMSFSRMVVETMVEYCHSNQITRIASSMSLSKARDLVHVSEIAQVVQLPGLANQTLELVRTLLQKQPHLACPLLDESGELKGDISGLALQTIADRPREALLYQKHKVLPQSVVQLSGKTLLQVYQNRDLNCTESFLFYVLLKWLEVHDTQKDIAHQCCKSLDIHCMKPSFLVDTVAPSGLIPQPKIDAALQKMALGMEYGGHQQFMQTRRELFKHQALKQSPRYELALLSNGVSRDGNAVEQHAQIEDYPPYQDEFSPRFSPLNETGIPIDDSFGVGQKENMAGSQSFSRVASNISVNGLQEALPNKASKQKKAVDSCNDKRKSKQSEQPIAAPIKAEKPMQIEGPVKGRFVRLAEQLDNMCVCGANQPSSTETAIIYQ